MARLLGFDSILGGRILPHLNSPKNSNLLAVCDVLSCSEPSRTTTSSSSIVLPIVGVFSDEFKEVELVLMCQLLRLTLRFSERGEYRQEFSF